MTAAGRPTILRRRSEFLRVRGGLRWVAPAFVLEARARSGPETDLQGPRFGFTVTKKLGKAVTRNRIRRRLREAVRTRVGLCARPEFDYVIVARAAASTVPFDRLADDLVRAFERVHARPARQGGSQ
ncbi:MAG: ribonuclease P protein component [Hyphomicrobiaceae bacterium]